jgi:FtsH-binding integral membrane protein
MSDTESQKAKKDLASHVYTILAISHLILLLNLGYWTFDHRLDRNDLINILEVIGPTLLGSVVYIASNFVQRNTRRLRDFHRSTSVLVVFTFVFIMGFALNASVCLYLMEGTVLPEFSSLLEALAGIECFVGAFAGYSFSRQYTQAE